MMPYEYEVFSIPTPYCLIVARCLIPKQTPGVAQMINRTSASITLELPIPERDTDCNNVSLATVRFTVYYGSVNSDGTSECTVELSFCQKLVSLL